MDDLLAALVGRLEEFGLQVDPREHLSVVDIGHDVDLVLSRGQARQEFVMELKRHATFSGLGYDAGTDRNFPPLLIGAASVSPRSADAFRRAGIQYVDAAGNAWIRFGDVLIDVRGRRPSKVDVPDRPGIGGNLFSTGRAQVAFVLLQWPRSWKKPQRDVAEAAGVSLGQAHNALAMFRDVGFGPGGHRSYSEFLDLWVASFPSGLARKLILATYRGSIEDFRKVNAEDPVFVGGAVVSGAAAADDHLRPAALTIYVAGLDPMLPVKNRWRSDGEPNITVRLKFWKTPTDETHDYDGPLVGLRNAPDVLVYADLMASDDPRVRDTATEWRERVAPLQRSF
jgi:hypothetical protein